MSHNPSLNLPIELSYWEYEYWTWKLRKNGELVSEKGRFQSARNMPTLARELYPWELREQFLAVDKHPDEVVNFLNRTAWHGGPHEETDWPRGRRMRNVEDFTQLQNLVRIALRRRYKNWKNLKARFLERTNVLLSGVEATIRWSKKRPVVRIEVESPFDAIIVSVKIDAMMGERFRFCARRDCQRLYKVRSRHSRRYCRQYCAHIENVRRTRKRKQRKRK